MKLIFVAFATSFEILIIDDCTSTNLCFDKLESACFIKSYYFGVSHGFSVACNVINRSLLKGLANSLIEDDFLIINVHFGARSNWSSSSALGRSFRSPYNKSLVESDASRIHSVSQKC